MINKQFSDRLNKELDNIGIPARHDERVAAFAKLLKLSKFKAESFLYGTILPDCAILNLIANELEVSVDWLIGKSKERHKEH